VGLLVHFRRRRPPMDGGADGVPNPEALRDEYMAGGGLGSMHDGL
jgi:hypothetical protein